MLALKLWNQEGSDPSSHFLLSGFPLSLWLTALPAITPTALILSLRQATSPMLAEEVPPDQGRGTP